MRPALEEIIARLPALNWPDITISPIENEHLELCSYFAGITCKSDFGMNLLWGVRQVSGSNDYYNNKLPIDDEISNENLVEGHPAIEKSKHHKNQFQPIKHLSL